MCWNVWIGRKLVCKRVNESWKRHETPVSINHAVSRNEDAFVFLYRITYITFMFYVYHWLERHFIIALSGKSSEKKTHDRFMWFHADAEFYWTNNRKYTDENRYFSYCPHTFSTWLHKFSLELSAVVVLFFDWCDDMKICFFSYLCDSIFKYHERYGFFVQLQIPIDISSSYFNRSWWDHSKAMILQLLLLFTICSARCNLTCFYFHMLRHFCLI